MSMSDLSVGSRESVVIHRRRPVNLVENDNCLFEREYTRTSYKPAYSKSYFVLFDFHTFNRFNKRSFFKQSRLMTKETPLRKLVKRRISIIRSGVVVVDIWSCNYFHWFTEVIPKLLFITEKRKKVILHLPESFLKTGFVKSSLSFFPNVKVKVTSGPSINFLFVAETFNLNISQGNYHEELIVRTCSFIKERVKSDCSKTYKRIFIYRDIKDKRGIINYKEIEAVLNKYEVHVVDFGSLRWEEQMNITTNCELLIGVHGAGLTNMMFMPEGSKVVELRRENDKANNCYFSLASALNHSYFYQCCQVDDQSLATQQNNFYVDAGNFDNLLASILK